MQIDQSCNVTWAKVYSGNPNGEGSLVKLLDGGYMVSDRSLSIMMKISSDGTYEWGKRIDFPDSGSSGARFVTQESNDSYDIIGVTHMPPTGYAAFFIKTDSEGTASCCEDFFYDWSSDSTDVTSMMVVNDVTITSTEHTTEVIPFTLVVSDLVPDVETVCP